jgi:predicted HTH transcriptional regulator
MADRVILQVWRRSAKSRGLLLRFEETENLLLSYLRSEGRITVKEFRILAGINARRAEKILSDFILCGLITYEGSEKGIFYRLSNFSPDQTR